MMRAMDVGTTGAAAETRFRLGTGGTIETTAGIIGGGRVVQEMIAGGTTQTGAGGIGGTAAAVGAIVRTAGATIGVTLAGGDIKSSGVRALPSNLGWWLCSAGRPQIIPRAMPIVCARFGPLVYPNI